MERRAALEQICRKFNVAILYAFGSRADEVWEWLEGKIAELAPGPSDVDVGVKAVPGVKLWLADEVHLALELEEWLGIHRVDVVRLDRVNPFLAEEVIRGERLYARDEYEADEYDLFVLRRAGDLEPLEREKIALVLRETI